MMLFLMIFELIAAPWLEDAPADLHCEPPPKKTITVPCEPHEGCEEKWIFVADDPDLPIS